MGLPDRECWSSASALSRLSWGIGPLVVISKFPLPSISGAGVASTYLIKLKPDVPLLWSLGVVTARKL